MTLIQLAKKQLEEAVNIYSRAYFNYPIWEFLFPDETRRSSDFPYLWKFFLKFDMKCGHVFATSSKLEGLIALIPSEKISISLFKQILCGGFKVIRKCGLKFLKRSLPIEKYFEAERINNAPFSHFFITHVVVAPEYQRRGIGSRMFKELFEEFESHNRPYYLDTQVRTNVDFYKKAGFKVLNETKIPGTDMTNWGMLKK